MRRPQSVQHEQPDLRGSTLGQQPVVLDRLRQRPPVDQLHHQPRPTLLDHHVMHRDHSGMTQPSRRLSLPQRPLRQRIIRVVAGTREPDLLDRDVPAQQHVVCAPDGTHPAAPDRLHQPITARHNPCGVLRHTG
jgi:hypothetical protein